MGELEKVVLAHIHYYYYIDSQLASGDLLYDAGNPKQALCDSLERWDREGDGREG